MITRPLHVLVVDDSAVVREAMSAVLAAAGGISVATAPDPVVARRRIAAIRPDVLVLDLAMPREDGLSFLRDLMASDPIPVVICSSHSTRGSQVALEALREGAVDVIAKPSVGVRDFVQESAIQLVDAIRAAAEARLRPPIADATVPSRRVTAPAGGNRRPPASALVAIAASTGGPSALHEVLGAMPEDAPGMVVVQHMPAGFTAAFADHLNRHCRIQVKEAQSGDLVVPGRALIAPGDRHLVVRRQRGRLEVDVTSGALVSRHRPSADVLFMSAAQAAGADGLGVIMTGMGDDGAEGLLAMRAAGSATLAQDEASSVVFGMPREAVTRGAVDELVPLEGLAERILDWARSGATPAPIPRAHLAVERTREEQ